MKAKVLIKYYPGESGHKALRVYLEPAFDQAEKDLELIQQAGALDTFHIQECEVFDYKPKEEKGPF